MGAPNFDIPQGMQDIIAILNASDLWNVTVVRRDERLYLYDGDQMVFVADTQQETNAFLSGAFLTTYNGKSLDQIRTTIESGWFADRSLDEIADEVRRERLHRHQSA